jgi:hypothetical protein
MIKTFINFTEFYNFTNQNAHLFTGNDHVNEFRRLISQMNSGCSCQRNRYLPNIEQNYKSIGPALSTPTRESIKQQLNAAQVQLQHSGHTFLVF